MRRRSFFGAVAAGVAAPVVGVPAPCVAIAEPVWTGMAFDQKATRAGRLWGPSGMAHWYVDGDFSAPVTLAATGFAGRGAWYRYERDGKSHLVSAAAYGSELDFFSWRDGLPPLWRGGF